MKAIRLIFIFLFAVIAILAPAGPASAQAGGDVDEEIAMLEATLARLRPDLAALERAIADPAATTWMTVEGWRSATTEELVAKVAFLQLAAARPEARDRTERIAGLELPATLAETARERTNRPAQRLVREWSEAEGPNNQREVAAHQQALKRTIKTAEGWLAEQRAVKQASERPAAPDSAYSEGPCYIPAGNWQVGDSREVLEVTSDSFVIARKTRGSRNIPAGKVSFYVRPLTCDAGLQSADEGYVNPEWVRSRVAVRWIEPNAKFAIDWPGREEVTYTRVE